MYWPRICVLLLVACGSSSAGAVSEDAGPLDASTAADVAPPFEPACLLDPPTYTPPALVPSLPVEPKVLWTKPLGFSDPSYVPLLATADAIVIAARPYVYFFGFDGALKFKKSLPGSSVMLNVVADAAGNIYAASRDVVRIAPDGTETTFPIGHRANITAGFEVPYVTGIALDPTGTIHAVGSDGYLRGIRFPSTTVYETRFGSSQELLNRPTVFGVGGTVIVNETLFDPNTGVRIGPSRAYEDRGTAIVAGNGYRIVRPRSAQPTEFDYVDTCNRTVAKIQAFGTYSLPWLTTFDGGLMWVEGKQPTTPGTGNVDVYRTDISGQIGVASTGRTSAPILLGADGSVISYATEDNKSTIVATSERFEERWKIPVSGIPSRRSTLLPNGILYVVDEANWTLSAIQTPLPGFAAVPQHLVGTIAQIPPRNWVGEK